MLSESVSYPPVPPHASYASCYCEENIYRLAASFLDMPDFRASWDLSVVFTSNQTKTASDPPALLRQQAACEEGFPVVWDYHVVLVLRPVLSDEDDDTLNGVLSIRTGSLIYDFDTTLDLPYDAQRGYLFYRVLSLPWATPGPQTSPHARPCGVCGPPTVGLTSNLLD
ncbi:N-terminal glutamine amidase-domain-containing protein [Thelephora terrestris]|uniref:Protein N-terminal glutamine amidohydrolase n=1 Tax=Thelephora terrestris TaxID=56493 RepID=A0A9P6LBZ7_9AGAM|nr:N-terminal glutamine amidase-domain-containing protein [Thelephora terrestris]